MSYLLFIDESRHGAGNPHDVLAGIAVHDTQLWDLICDAQDSEIRHFGRRMTGNGNEMKASELLKKKTFRLAAQEGPIPEAKRQELVVALLSHPEQATRAQLTALGQAKIAYAAHLLELCATHGVRCFASIVKAGAPRPAGGMLRKDFAYLFERFFYYVDAQRDDERGLIIFDEVERTQARHLATQMSAYFRGTFTGRLRAGRVIPEPFFVHSDLTTGVQLADLVAYIVATNIRIGGLIDQRRTELDTLGQALLSLRFRALVDRQGYPNGFNVWSFVVIDDLRPRDEREIY